MSEELKNAILELLKAYILIAPTDAISEFKDLDADDLALCHFGMGMYLRNNFLNPGSKIYELFELNGVQHKDDMSSEIIHLWYEALRTEQDQLP